jgi:tRNA G10  N-methylase Trm11
MDHSKSSGALEKHVQAAIRDTSGSNETISHNNKKFHTFRIVISNENKPAAIDEKRRAAAEGYISRLSGLKVNRTNPDTEFWFLYRREEGASFSVFMKRLTLHPSREKSLHKGELPPPLAWTLCRLAHLVHNDVILDPFCGYGSIPEAALKHFHITKFIACDNNREAALYTAARFKKRQKGDFILHQADFVSLPSLIAEKSIDVIITDPPWGLYKEIDDEQFHVKMFDVFDKLLKDSGRIVMLYANDDEVLKAAPSCFTLECRIPILLSGRKAAIFVFGRTFGIRS